MSGGSEQWWATFGGSEPVPVTTMDFASLPLDALVWTASLGDQWVPVSSMLAAAPFDAEPSSSEQLPPGAMDITAVVEMAGAARPSATVLLAAAALANAMMLVMVVVAIVALAAALH